jgi:hypothetical protein
MYLMEITPDPLDEVLFQTRAAAKNCAPNDSAVTQRTQGVPSDFRSLVVCVINHPEVSTNSTLSHSET